jgi:flagellar motor component MotA
VTKTKNPGIMHFSLADNEYGKLKKREEYMDRTIFYLILRNLHCDENEKESCFELITSMINFIKKVKKEGLLSLEDDIEKIENNFLRTGFEMLTSGYDQYYVYNILITMICASRNSDLQVLHKLIILEGIISIINNESEDLAMWKLTAILGDGYKKKLIKHSEQLQK